MLASAATTMLPTDWPVGVAMRPSACRLGSCIPQGPRRLLQDRRAHSPPRLCGRQRRESPLFPRTRPWGVEAVARPPWDAVWRGRRSECSGAAATASIQRLALALHDLTRTRARGIRTTRGVVEGDGGRKDPDVSLFT